MKMEPVVSGYATVISAYGDGGFTVAGQRRAGSILLLPESIASWNVTDINDLTIDSLDTIAEHAADIELLIVGTGSRPGAPAARLSRSFQGTRNVDRGHGDGPGVPHL